MDESGAAWPRPFSGLDGWEHCSGRPGSIVSGVGTVLQLRRLAGGGGLAFPAPIARSMSQAGGCTSPWMWRCSEGCWGGGHVSRVINSSRNSLALQTGLDVQHQASCCQRLLATSRLLSPRLKLPPNATVLPGVR